VADVAVDLPVDRIFSYTVAEDIKDAVSPGSRVIVPFGRRRVTGYIVSLSEKKSAEDLKSVEACLDREPLLDEGMISLLQWVSNYYLSPLGEVIRTALPSGINSSSNRFARITGKGIEGIEAADGRERELLLLIGEKGELAVSDIERRFGKNRSAYLLGRLAGVGLIEVNARLKTARVRGRKEKYVIPLPEEETGQRDPGRIGKKSRQIVEYLRDKKEASLLDIVRELKTTRETVKRLEKRGLIRIFDREVYRDPYYLPVREVVPPALTEHQKRALDDIRSAAAGGGYLPFLIEGITGSGKTELYIRSIEMAGGKAIVLVPEISLTPQLTSRFRERFGDRVAVLHSGLSPGERYDQWRRIKDGTFDIVIGARSAIFAPIRDLRIIIVDEEHESSYKQEEGVRYNARDLALVRGKMAGAIVLLGSATPSLESRINADKGRFQNIRLPERINRAQLPAVDIVDMRKEARGSWISSKLKQLVDETLQRNEQVILFLNRRGFAPFVLCQDCGYTFKCRNCTVSLTWHRKRNLLRCHHCDFKMPALPLCSVCGGANLKGLGEGTEKLEDDLGEIFKGAVISRIDRDTVRGRGKMEKILNSFERGEVDILVGTQMIAKGHHFPGVTLVGVLLADLSLNVPDFRAAERTFQLITQVAGRAGRGDMPGRVLIQTYSPEHYSILHGGEEVSEEFYQTEIAIRKEMRYPPFSRLLNFRMEGAEEKGVISCADELRQVGKKTLKLLKIPDLEMIGPAPSPMSRVRGKYRWQMLVRCKESAPLHSFARTVLSEMKTGGRAPAGVKITPDFDPYSLV